MHGFGRIHARNRVPRKIGDAAIGNRLGMVEHPCRFPDGVAGKLDLDREIGQDASDRLVLTMGRPPCTRIFA